MLVGVVVVVIHLINWMVSWSSIACVASYLPIYLATTQTLYLYTVRTYRTIPYASTEIRAKELILCPTLSYLYSLTYLG